LCPRSLILQSRDGLGQTLNFDFDYVAAPGHSQEELFRGAACKKERKRKEKLRRQQNTPCTLFREQALERLQEKQKGRYW